MGKLRSHQQGVLLTSAQGPALPTELSIPADTRGVFRSAFLFWGRKWVIIRVSLADGEIGGVKKEADSLSP